MTITFTFNQLLNPHSFEGYNHQRFSGNIINYGKANLLIFNSNEMNVVGLKSLEQGINLISTFFPNVNIQSAKIVNIVATGLIDFRIYFNEMVNKNDFTWEPELFPGIMFRRGKKVATMFTSNKVNLVGAKSTNELETIFDELISTLNQYKL